VNGIQNTLCVSPIFVQDYYPNSLPEKISSESLRNSFINPGNKQTLQKKTIRPHDISVVGNKYLFNCCKYFCCAGWTAFSDYTGPDLLCSTVFHF